ncbi:MAG: glycine--tRNA ligase [Verrucomicrobiae bacterium]|nr:glycine--tRNA ligase [Verrucomicrobiae bacterium]
MAEPKENVLMEKIVSLCKRRGFVFQSSEIYGGINGFWDYGPLGAELKRNVKDAWWTSMTRLRDDVVGLDATIIMSPLIWKASGHVDTFSDPMCDCTVCKKRVRADQVFDMIWESKWGQSLASAADAQSLSQTVSPTRILAEDSPFRRWSSNKAKSEAPSLALVQNFSVVFGEIEKRFSIPASTTPWPSFAELVCLVGGDPYDPDSSASPPCPHCGGKLTAPRAFNLMLQTYVGPIQSDDNVAYLRPETAQAIFAQFKNVHETSRQKVPFGIAQIGKAFRNEVTPRNFTFRSREFEQMELEFFIKPDEAIEAIHGSVATPTAPGHPGEPQPNWGWQMWHQYWVEERIQFYGEIGLPRTTLEEYWQKPEELAHYARATVDILFKFPFGTQELEGIAARSDFDLSQHERHSGKPMGVFDEELRTAWGKLAPEKQKELSDRYHKARLKYLIKSGVPAEKAEKDAREDADGLAKGQYIPHVIEPSAGCDRLILALVANAFSEVTETDAKGKSETRVVMKFHPRVAPTKAAVFPLLKNKPELVAKARGVHETLRRLMKVDYDEGGSIGRRYARQDEVGTPFGVTIDFDTLGEKPELLDTVTIRHRDDGRQERVPIAELPQWLLARIQ